MIGCSVACSLETIFYLTFYHSRFVNVQLIILYEAIENNLMKSRIAVQFI